MKITLTLATLLLAATLSAQDQTHVYPLAPTTATPIEVHYLSNCRARSHEVIRQDAEIIIIAHDQQCPAVLPIPIVEKVKLPAIPAGAYDVIINGEHDPFFLTGTRLVVREATPAWFELRPAEVDAYEDEIVRISGVGCAQPSCEGVTVRVGGEPVAIVRGDDTFIEFTTPIHAPGLVDVSVEHGGVVTTAPKALLFMDYTSSHNLGGMTAILFPIVETVDGAFGSRWQSALTVSNPTSREIYPEYTLNNIGPCVGPCDPAFDPKSVQTYQYGYPHGTVMWARRSEAEDLAFALRIRDVSKQTQGWGTEVPVVRERDFIHGENIHLLDVPLDPRYRVKVRVYMIEPVIAPSLSGAVRIRRADRQLEIPFTFEEAKRGLRIEPYYAEIDLPQGLANERVHVEIVMPLDAHGWAFASVTNNETQQVTVVAPQ